MITRAEWTSELVNLGKRMVKAKTKYNYKKPITPANCLKQCTCVGYVASALQEKGLLPKGAFIHMENGKLLGSGWEYIKKHPEMYEILHVNATPQKLGDKLKVGDICLYNVPHVQVSAGRNKSGTPIWYSLERGSGGIGKQAKLTLAAVFGYYSKRKIDYIVRLKFDAAQTKPTTTTNTSTAVSKPATAVEYKLLTGMNIRKTASASSTKVGYAPKGAVITQTGKSGTWVKCTYCGVTGWINCAAKYATKV